MKLIAFDTETFLIGPGAVAPRAVCGSFFDGKDRLLLGNHPKDGLKETLRDFLKDKKIKLLTYGGGFDWAVVCVTFPELIPLVFEKLASYQCTDAMYRELLLNLSTTGQLDGYKSPSGKYIDLKYGLADVLFSYTGDDRRTEKDDPESWRLNFKLLDGWRAKDYPEEPYEYALADAEDTYRIYQAQEDRKQHAPFPTTTTEEYQTWSAFSLYLETAWGIKVNRSNVQKMKDAVVPIIEDNKSLLIKWGILQPGKPAEPHAKQIPLALELLEQKFKEPLMSDRVGDDGWEPYREFLESEGIKFKKATNDVIKQAPLQARAEALYKSLGELPELTPNGAISIADPVPTYLAQYDEVFGQFAARQELIKLRTQHIPLLESAEIIHANYRVLVRTGRTSSFGTRKGKLPLYPSTNIQQVPAAEIEGVDVRQCYEPREGTVYWDCDGTTQELACVGQITYDLFGNSVHRDRYNAGIDLHGYLASSLVIQIGGPGLPQEFAQLCRQEGILGDEIAVYEAFMECKNHTEKDVREKFYKHWRTFAKPTGLGFPGGLGPKTMVAYAKATYGVDMTEDQAREAREVWRATYPEMPLFHRWINGQTDDYNSHGEDTLYQYTTRLGMVRRGADYCAAANGKSMQSPGAEAMKLANNMIVRECYDRTQNSVLYGCRPIVFLHDQIIGETTQDESLWDAQCRRVAELMVFAHGVVLPDIKFRCDEAHLTRVWSKKSFPVKDKKGRLIPWTPEAT